MEADFRQLWPLMATEGRHRDAEMELLNLIKPSPNPGDTPLRQTPSLCDHLSAATLSYLSAQLTAHPYPTLQIIRLLPPTVCASVAWPAARFYIETLLHNPTDSVAAIRLVTLLGHIEWPDTRLPHIRREAFAALDSVATSSDDDGNRLLWLSWLSHPQSLVLLDYLQHLQTRRQQPPFSLAHIFYRATSDANAEHFLAECLQQHDDDTDCSRIGCWPPAAHRLQAAVQLARLLSSMPAASLDETSLERLSAISGHFTTGLAQSLLADVGRLLQLQQRLYYHVPNLDLCALAGQLSVIDYLGRNLSLNTFDADRARAILSANREAGVAIWPEAPLDASRPTEQDLYEQFGAVRRLYEAIAQRVPDPTAQTAALAACRKSLRAIEALAAFAAAVEQCFALLFIRWDHVQHVDDLDRTVESGSESSATPPTATFASDGIGQPVAAKQQARSAARKPLPGRRQPEKYGFICSADCLAAVLRMLRLSIAWRTHKETEMAAGQEPSADHTAALQRLTAVSAWIADATWRLSLFRAAEASSAAAEAVEAGPGIEKIDVRRLLGEHPGRGTQGARLRSSSSSSDGGSDGGPQLLPDLIAGGRERGSRRRPARRSAPPSTTKKPAANTDQRISNTLPRRKPRKQRPFAKLAGGERSVSFSHSTENERRPSLGRRGRQLLADSEDGAAPATLDKTAPGSGAWDGGRRCIVSRMLGSAEHLVTVCMNRGDLRQTRQMIREHGLEKSMLAGELHYTEAFQQTKEKLRLVFDRLRAAGGVAAPEADTSGSISAATTVDRIKRAAAIGLDVSTITQIIARFATGTPVHLCEPTETHRVLHKYREKLPFLGLYQPGESLQATVVCDLLVSLANTGDIASNVFEVMQKLWPSTRDAGVEAAASATAAAANRGIGYVAFLGDAVAAMRQHGAYRQQQQPQPQQQQQPQQSISMQSVLSDDYMVIEQAELADWLAREQIFERLRTLQLDDCSTLQQLHQLQPAFQRVRTARRSRNAAQPSAVGQQPHLFGRVNDFVQNASRLLGNRSPTELLQIDWYARVGEMVLLEKRDPAELEALLCGMNMNLAHVLAVNLGPIVGGNTNVSPSKLTSRLIEDEIWSYLGKQNAMLCGMLQRLNSQRSAAAPDDLDNLAGLADVRDTAVLYDNSVWTALMFYDRTGYQDVCRMVETTKDYGAATRALRSLRSIHRHANLAEIRLLQDTLIQNYLRSIFHSPADTAPYQLIDNIADCNQRATCLLRHMLHISDAALAIRLIRGILLHDDSAAQLQPKLRDDLQLWLRNVNVYARCTQLMNQRPHRPSASYRRNWLQVRQLSESRPDRIVEVLLDSDEFALCRQWSLIHPIDNSLTALVAIFTRTVCRLLAVDADLFELFESLPRLRIREIYQQLISVVNNVQVLRYLIDFLQQKTEEAKDDSDSEEQQRLTHRVNISLRIFELSTADQDDTSAALALPWHLLTAPLLIIEQYLMNARFDALTHVMSGLQPLLERAAPCSFCHDRRNLLPTDERHAGDGDASSRHFCASIAGDGDEFALLHSDFAQRPEHTLATNCVDSLLRIYASKALDIRVSQRRGGEEQTQGGDDDAEDDRRSHITACTLASTDSLAPNAASSAPTTFCMPSEPPTRPQWTRDEDARRCQCCRRAVFTMLTRRHHCRQCGRVVCHACSQRRAFIVSLYADVAVRVCDDCHHQLTAERDRTSLAALGGAGGGKQRGSQADFSATAGGNTTPRHPLSRQATIVSLTPGAGGAAAAAAAAIDSGGWQFSGDRRHDELLRSEFSYEFAPSVSLCLSILGLHSTGGPECAQFLLQHCGRFEALLRPLQPEYPNPEVDYALVTRMLHCLALAAKVRGGPPECDVVLEHADIIRAIVQHRCEALLPMEPLTRNSFRRLRDSLVVAEKWQLALEVSLKCGFATTGVMAAWGIAQLRAGCLETAREKFAHCMQRPAEASEDDVAQVMASIGTETSQFSATIPADMPQIRRARRSPPLLAEIVSILETTPPQPLGAGKVQRQSAGSLMGGGGGSGASTGSAASSKRGKRAQERHEPALNILHTLANLRHIAAGTFEVAASPVSSVDTSPNISASCMLASTSSLLLFGSNRSLPSQPGTTPPLSDSADHAQRPSPATAACRLYDECLYYLCSYASHSDLIAFLVRRRRTRAALKYVHYQRCDAAHFVHTLFVPHLRRGAVGAVVRHMCEMDETLVIWRRHLIAVCAHLERSAMLNSLYQLQLLIRDPVRASMTCVRFYERGAESYADLQAHAFHLHNAEQHLARELELCQWEELPVVAAAVEKRPHRRQRSRQVSAVSAEVLPVRMKWDARALNSHIGTIGRQLEVAKFLAACEQAGRPTARLLPALCMQSAPLPTLFGSSRDKVQLAMLVLICGSNVTEGFGLAYRVIQDFRLDAEAVFTATAKYLAGNQRLAGVEQLLECIRGNVLGSRVASAAEEKLCDRILAVAVDTCCGGLVGKATVATGGNLALGGGSGQRRRMMGGGESPETGASPMARTAERELFDRLVRQIADVSVRIHCYIAGGQLKSAYLLAVQHDRETDIRKVMRHAEAGNQPMIRRLCEKKLGLME